MKKTATFIAIAALVCIMALCVSADFAKVNDYSQGQFSDVASEKWYSTEVKNAFEIGLMNGVSSSLFSPDGSVSVAECITMAARIHSINSGTAIPEKKNDVWYEMYVDYAAANGMIKDTSAFDNYSRPIKRSEMAELFARALPKDAYSAKNDIKTIPDVSDDDDYCEDVLMLYRAGILCGNDSYGFLSPDSGLRRSEAAAIVNRIAIPENRRSFSLLPVREAFYLTDDQSMMHTVRLVNRLTSSWNYENRFDKGVNASNTTTSVLADGSTDGYSAINRYIEPQSTGIFTFETQVSLSGALNGARIYIENKEGKNVFEIYTKDSFFHVKAKENVKTNLAVNNQIYFIRVSADLDKKTGVLSIDGKKICDFELCDDYGEFAKLYYSTTPEDILILEPKTNATYMNYSVNENFACGAVPYDFTTDTGTVAKLNEPRDVYSLTFDKSGYAQKKFEPLFGKIICEGYVYLPNTKDEAYVSLMSGETDAVKVELSGSDVKCGNVSRAFRHTQWQVVHIEADTENGRAVIFINGKNIGTVPMTAANFDSIKLSYVQNSEGAKCYFDDLKVYNTYDYPDYCPEPVKAESPDYTLIMSVCPLWREGTHYGWDFISPYDENSPLLGYYDEGIPEQADWEIKQMCEHGIDAEQYCWFAGIPETFNWTEDAYSIPMKTPQNSWALHDGYFYSKYSDKLKFCILWENGAFKAEWTGNKVMSLESFKNYLWDYWVDYYFTDPRYLTIDNKVVFEIYSRENFLTLFGGSDSAEQVKKAKEIIDFMRADIKNYGFSDIIITFSENGLNEAITQNLLNIGSDGLINYGYGKQSFDPEYLKEAYSKAIENAGIDKNIAFVPTISIGYNIVAWEGIRSPLATVEQHKKTLEYAKEALAQNSDKAESWAKQTILFSTWNEFGEGHWLSPSGLNGYGYADAWRSAFTNAPELHEDVLPTQRQKARICHMYNTKRTLIRPYGEEPENPIDRPSLSHAKITAEDMNKSGWIYGKIDDKELKTNASGESILYGKSNAGDCFIFSPQNEDLGINTADVAMIHISMRSLNGAESGQIYYVNDDDVFDKTSYNPWQGKYSFFFQIPDAGEDGYSDVYIDTKNSKYDKYWKGIIHRLRFDPVDMADHGFEIKYIDFLGYSEEQKKGSISVDGTVLEIPISQIERTDTEWYVVGDPSYGIYSANNFYHEFNRYTGRLYIKTGNNTEFEFFLGKDTVLVNGKEEKLSKEFYAYDHIPVLPLRFILDKAGIKYSIDENGMHINMRDITASLMDENDGDSFEFDTPGDFSEFSVRNASAFVSDGALILFPSSINNSSGYDPNIVRSGLSIPTAKYKEVAVRVHCIFGVNKKGESKNGTRLYFTTDLDPKLDETKAFTCYDYDAENQGDGYYLFKFPVAENQAWNGTLKSIRFDTPENNGIYSIDYIRFVRNPNYVEPAPGQTDDKTNSVIDYKKILASQPIEKVDSQENVDSYEFNDKKLQGFGILNADYEFDDNNLILTAKTTPSSSTGYDTGILKSGLTIPASAYKTIVVRVKPIFGENNNGTFKTVSKIYFTTDKDDKRDEVKTLRFDIKNAYDDGNGYYLFVYDTKSNEAWKDVITSLMFDPTDNNGKYYIDYIRFAGGDGSRNEQTLKEEAEAKAAENSKPSEEAAALIGTMPNPPINTQPNKVSYEFDKKTTEGFGVLNAEQSFDEDNIILTAKPVPYGSSGYDVGLLKTGLTVSALDYTKVVIRMKPLYLTNNDRKVRTVSKLYFTTAADSARNEEKALKCDISNAYEDGDGYYVFVFDSYGNSFWTGNITSIMFDTTDNNGIYTIDYIRFAE